MSGFVWYTAGLLFLLANAFIAGTEPFPSRQAFISGGIAVGVAIMIILKFHSLSGQL